jgi:hypothetical protein
MGREEFGFTVQDNVVFVGPLEGPEFLALCAFGHLMEGHFCTEPRRVCPLVSVVRGRVGAEARHAYGVPFQEGWRGAVADPVGKAFVLFGAGSAARAIAVETALAGAASITIVNRDLARGSGLVALLSEKTQARADLVGWDRTYRIPQATDIVVNATSIGLFPHVEGRLDLDLDSLRPGLVVADVIPNPAREYAVRPAR